MAEEGSLSYLYNTEQELGTMPNILYSKGSAILRQKSTCRSVRAGSGIKMKIHSLERLYVYLTSVGANSCMHLNLPPTTEDD